MHHYLECGLPNVYLLNGYREIDTPHGAGISIAGVEELHTTIANSLVEEKPSLTGPEVRFIRKLLELTQSQLAEMLGVEDQLVRRWEKLDQVPKQADHGVRLVFRDITHRTLPPLAELVKRLNVTPARKPRAVRYRYHARSSDRWQAQSQHATA
jgi:putative transcriptional regulator